MSETPRTQQSASGVPEKTHPEQRHWSTWYDAFAPNWVLESDGEEIFRTQDPEKIMDTLSELAKDGDTCDGLPVWYAYQEDPYYVHSED